MLDSTVRLYPISVVPYRANEAPLGKLLVDERVASLDDGDLYGGMCFDGCSLADDGNGCLADTARILDQCQRYRSSLLRALLSTTQY